MKIAKISIQRSSLTLVVFLVLILVGAFSYTKLSYELTPSMEIPINTIATVYPGAAPGEVENSVTRIIEDAVSGIEGVDEITSYSYENISLVIIRYFDNVDATLMLQDVERKINQISNDLPEDCKDPVMEKVDVTGFPIMSIGVSSDLPTSEFYDLIKQRVQPMLAQAQGVAQVEIIGGQEREIQINIDRTKLEAYNLSIQQVYQMLKASNMEFPTGKLKDNHREMGIRLSGKFKSPEVIRQLIIGATPQGSVIRIQDIAEVVDGVKEAEKITRVNGEPSIGLSILKQTDANAVEVSEKVYERLAEVQQTYGKDSFSYKVAMDTSEFTLEAAHGVMVDLILAILLVSLTMLLFLKSIRNSLFVIIAIPVSLISTFTAMYVAGFTLNLMTLLALSIVVGSLVDDAIVVIENIHRHMEMGKKAAQASYDAVKELGMTVTAITLVLVAVFLPVSFVTGITGNLLREFSLVIVFSILISLLVSFTLVPLMTSRFAKVENLQIKGFWGIFIRGFDSIIERTNNGILSALNFALDHKTITLIGSLALLIGSFMLVGKGFIQSEFMTEGDRGEFMIQIELPKDATLEQSEELSKEAEEIIRESPLIETVFTTIGTIGGQLAFQAMPYASEMKITLIDKNLRDINTASFSRELRNKLERRLTGPKIKAISVNMLGMTKEPLHIIVQGPDMETLIPFSKEIEQTLNSITGTLEIKNNYEEGSREARVSIDREKLARLGLNMAQVGSDMRIAFAGDDELKFRDGAYEYDIRVRYDQYNKKALDDLNDMAFTNNTGQSIRLNQFASIEEQMGPLKLERFNRLPAISIKGQVKGRTTGSIGDELRARVAKMNIPAGVEVIYSGDLKSQADAFSSLGLALIASILFMYFIMVALYNSWIYPLVVLFSIPLAIIGALLALALARQTLSVFSIMGIIMLVGLVAKNAILVVDFTNDLKAEGMPLRKALIEATRLRFRPILMTNLSMIIGLMPLAMASAAGSEWKHGLGWSLIGGLTSSMFLSLIIVPVIYYIADKLLARWGFDKQKIIELNE